MPRIVAGLCLSLALATPAAAQDWGLKAGLQSATFAVKSATGTDAARRMPALVFGLFNVLSDGRVAPELDVLLSVKGAHVTIDGQPADYVITYAELPVLVKVDLLRSERRRLFVVAGPYLGSRWAARGRYASSSADIKDQVERYDFGWQLGAGVWFDRLALEARYAHGLRNVDTTLHDDSTFENRTFAVTAGIVF